MSVEGGGDGGGAAKADLDKLMGLRLGKNLRIVGPMSIEVGGRETLGGWW